MPDGACVSSPSQRGRRGGGRGRGRHAGSQMVDEPAEAPTPSTELADTRAPHARLAHLPGKKASDSRSEARKIASSTKDRLVDVCGGPDRGPVRAPPTLPAKKGRGASVTDAEQTDAEQHDDDGKSYPPGLRAQRINGAIGEGTAPAVPQVGAEAQDHPEDGASSSTVTVPLLGGAQLDRLATHRPRADRVLSRSPEPDLTPPPASSDLEHARGSAGSSHVQTCTERTRASSSPTTGLPTATSSLPDPVDPVATQAQEDEQSERLAQARDRLDHLAVSGQETVDELYDLLSSAPIALASTNSEQHGPRVPLCAKAQRSNLRVLRDRYSSTGHFCIVMREVLMQLCRENGSALDDVPTTWEVAIDGNALALCKLPHSLPVEERSQLLLTAPATGFAECGRVTHFEGGCTVLHVEKSGLALAEFPTSLTVTVCIYSGHSSVASL